jgi:hypothetical protein
MRVAPRPAPAAANKPAIPARAREPAVTPTTASGPSSPPPQGADLVVDDLIEERK